MMSLGMSGYRIMRKFLPEKEIEHPRGMAMEGKLWLYDDPNGDRGAWFPEKEDVVDVVLEHAIAHSRIQMGYEPVADGTVCFFRYPFGGYVNPHKDTLKSGRHMRCNILLHDATAGGIFYIQGEPVKWEPGDAIIYRADELEHRVSKVREGERYLLTIGTIF